MYIKSYVELTAAQEQTINDFSRTVVHTSLLKPSVVATFKTFQAQEVKATIDENGVIQAVNLDDLSGESRHVHTVVILFQGVIDEVASCVDEVQAQDLFHVRTGVSWSEYLEKVKTEDSESILGDYAGSGIWDNEYM